MPHSLTAEQYRSRAHALYQAGVDHLFFWDGGWGRGGSNSAWEAMRRLGHREEIEAWVRAGSREFQRPGSELVKLRDWDLSYTIEPLHLSGQSLFDHLAAVDGGSLEPAVMQVRQVEMVQAQ